MGFVYVEVKVHGRKTSRSMPMLADTGSTYIVLDPNTIEELGLSETGYRVSLTLADRRRVEVELFWAEVEAQGRKGLAFIAALGR